MIPPFDRNRHYFKHQHTFDIKPEGTVSYKKKDFKGFKFNNYVKLI